jgi:hypothetical protein
MELVEPTNLFDYIGRVITGQEFNDNFSDLAKTLVKLTTKTEIHNGFQFKSGENVDINPFNFNVDCGANGIYFTDINNLPLWLDYRTKTMKFCRKVILPPDCKIQMLNNKFKADKIILGDRIKIKDMDIWKDEEYCIRAINQNESAFRYIREPSVSLQILFVKNKGSNIRYIKDPNEDIQIEALKQNPCLITHIEQPCRLAQLIAVSYNGFLIKHIKNTEITEEVQLEAVKQNGKCIEYIRDPSENVKVAADYGISGF